MKAIAEVTPEMRADINNLLAAVSLFNSKYGIRQVGITVAPGLTEFTIFGEDLFTEDGKRRGFISRKCYLDGSMRDMFVEAM
jgi:hypothetical protein